jgi:hypothetical protein
MEEQKVRLRIERTPSIAYSGHEKWLKEFKEKFGAELVSFTELASVSGNKIILLAYQDEVLEERNGKYDTDNLIFAFLSINKRRPFWLNRTNVFSLEVYKSLESVFGDELLSVRVRLDAKGERSKETLYSVHLHSEYGLKWLPDPETDYAGKP